MDGAQWLVCAAGGGASLRIGLSGVLFALTLAAPFLAFMDAPMGFLIVLVETVPSR